MLEYSHNSVFNYMKSFLRQVPCLNFETLYTRCSVLIASNEHKLFSKRLYK